MDLPRVIYALRHDATGKMYIGSTANLRTRYQKHINRLKNGKHNAKQLQEDYDKYDNKSISIIALDVINEFCERDKEYEWMARYQTFDREYGYNYADPKLPRRHF